MKTYRILTVLTATLFLAASPLSLPADDAPPDFFILQAPRDADAVLGKIELDVALKEYEKVLTAKAEADLQCRLGPTESGLTEKQEQQWYNKQQEKRDILADVAERLRAQIRERIEEGNKAARAKEEAKANEEEKAKAATSAPKQ